MRGSIAFAGAFVTLGSGVGSPSSPGFFRRVWQIPNAGDLSLTRIGLPGLPVRGLTARGRPGVITLRQVVVRTTFYAFFPRVIRSTSQSMTFSITVIYNYPAMN